MIEKERIHDFINKIKLYQLKNPIPVFFAGLLTCTILLFFIDLLFGFKHFEFESFIFQNFYDYLADFINHARFATDSTIYGYNGLPQELAERGLPPMEYLFSRIFSHMANYNSIPTLFLNGYSMHNSIAKSIYITNFALCIISVIFYTYLYEKLSINNKYLKFFIIITFLFTIPFMYELERGNSIFISAFCVAIYLFNYDSENKIKKELGLLALGFACALKLVPFLFIILLLNKKNYKCIFRVFLYFCIFFFAALFLLKEAHNILLFFRNAIINNKVYGYSNFKFFIILAIYFFIPVFKQTWKKVFIIAALLASLNNFTGYRLMYLYPVIVMFLNKSTFNRWDYVYAVLFLLIISPLRLLNNEFLIFLFLGLLINEQILIYINKNKKS